MAGMRKGKMRLVALVALTAVTIGAGYGASLFAVKQPMYGKWSIKVSEATEILRDVKSSLQDLQGGQADLSLQISEIAKTLKSKRQFEPLLERIRRVKLGSIEFDSGSSHIGTKGRVQVEEIVKKIKNDDSPLLVVGLADSCGTPSRNLNLSESRAQEVAKALHRYLGQAQVYVRGLGENVGEFLDQKCDSALYRTAHVVSVDTQVARDIIVLVPNRS